MTKLVFAMSEGALTAACAPANCEVSVQDDPAIASVSRNAQNSCTLCPGHQAAQARWRTTHEASSALGMLC